MLDSGATFSSLNDAIYDTPHCTEGNSIGINGTSITHPITPPLPVATPEGQELCTQSFAVLVDCPVSLMGRDLLSKLNITIKFDRGGSLTASSPFCDLHAPKRHTFRGLFASLPPTLETHAIWADNKGSVGFINCTPYTPQMRPDAEVQYHKQYPLPLEKIEGITPLINDYIAKGILKHIISPWNTPIYPVKKANGEWRLVQDLRAVNKQVIPLPPLVADISFIFLKIPADSLCYTVVDLANAFFSIPIDEGVLPMFSFSWGRGKQLTWSRLPQGYVDSPAAFSMVLNETIKSWTAERGSVLIQYVDDLLLCSRSAEDCAVDSTSLLHHLARSGHLASRKKIQWCQSQVEYLGCILKEGTRLVSPKRAAALQALSPPRDKATLLSFLGAIVYCRQWIPDCSYYDGILREATLSTAPKTVDWTTERLCAFQALLKSLTQAPALGLIEYGKPFQLYCVVSGNSFAAVLTQQHGTGYRPVSYLSKKLPTQVQGMPSCLQNLAACAMAVQEANKSVLGHELTLYTTHSVTHLLQNMNTQHMTAQRLSGYEITLLNTDNLTLKHAPPSNPTVRLLHSLLRLPRDPDQKHNCVEQVAAITSPRPDLTDIPLPGVQDVFIDGSCTRPSDATFLTGYAIVQLPDVVLEAKALPPSSAQVAELEALTRACILFSDEEVNIYTDSRYAFGVTHDYGVIWANRGFKTADNKPIANSTQIKALLQAILLPKRIAVIKVKAHSSDNSRVSKGNALADREAKKAAALYIGQPAPTTMFFKEHFTSPNFKTVVAQIQGLATEEDVSFWVKDGLTKDQEGLWSKEGKILGIPESSSVLILSYLHGPGHIGTTALTNMYTKSFCTNNLSKQAKLLTSSCLTCAQNNVQGKNHGLHGHLPPPLGPLTDLQIDFTHMPKQRGNLKCLCVIVCKWSGWIEGIPCTGETAKIAAKCILNHWVCRFGIPTAIWSDRGPAFSSSVTQTLAKLLGLQWKLHIPYHPQSAGVVERMNRNIKDKLKKATGGTMKGWLDYLPSVLFQIRTTPHARTKLSPFEILMGVPANIELPLLDQNTDINIYSQQEMYVKNLVSMLQDMNEQVSVTFSPLSTEPTHPFIPGDKVLVKQLAHKKKVGPIFSGPWKIEKVSRTAVLTDLGNTWIHASRLKKCPQQPQTPDPPPAPQDSSDQEQRPDLKDIQEGIKQISRTNETNPPPTGRNKKQNFVHST